MKCVNPIRLKNPNSKGLGFSDSYIEVGCGKCHGCLANRRRSWLYRLEVENRFSLFSLFCTFTLDDLHYPADGKVSKKDLQSFFKKLRDYEDFTYYAIGEYGTRTHRPHYHAVLFFKSMTNSFSLVDYTELISRLWYKGFVYVLPISTRRMNYVLHYHTRPKIVDNRETFCLFSKGLGVDAINGEFIRNLSNKHNRFVVHDFEGNSFVFPRYYIKKLKDSMIVRGSDVIKFNPTDIVNNSSFCEDFERKYGVKPYRCTESFRLGLFFDTLKADNAKLLKYNNQDKLL